MNKRESISLDDFLSQQAKTGFVATVEPTEDPDIIKLTPYVPNVGCLCGTALNIPKSLIDSVTPTGDAHLCCGKRLIVVEVTFKDGAQLPVTSVFEQMHALAQHPSHHYSPTPSRATPTESPPNYGWRGGDEYTPQHHGPSPRIVCPFGYQACFGPCAPNGACYSPARGESCSNGQVCQFGYRQCRCGCYNPAAGETCY